MGRLIFKTKQAKTALYLSIIKRKQVIRANSNESWHNELLLSTLYLVGYNSSPLSIWTLPAPIGQSVKCPLLFKPRPGHTKVFKNGTSNSSLDAQTDGEELGQIDPVSKIM